MNRRTVLILALGSVGAFAAAPNASAAEDATITIDNFTFSPAILTIPAGTSVTWINRDDIPHVVVSRDDPRAMRSKPLDTGDSFAFSFDRPGEYHYFCSLHPHMQGMIVVT